MSESPEQPAFVFAECSNPACRFRFPAERTDPRRKSCPRCRTATVLTNTSDTGTAAAPDRLPTDRIIVGLLDNIRSIHNVGSMFRTADGAGLRHLHVCGITATPEHPRLAKAALGTERSISWSYYSNAAAAAAELRARGYFLCALERIAADGQSLFEVTYPPGPIALIVGNEKAGIDPAVLAQCDGVYSLPMAGNKTSLNAAVAFGIAAYHLAYVRPAEQGRRHD